MKIDAAVPNTVRGRDAVTNIREGVWTGLSVEFHSRSEGRRGNLREIRSAYLGAAALVDVGAYAALRLKSGPKPERGPGRSRTCFDGCNHRSQLAAALRLGDGETAPTEPVAGLIARLLGVSQAFVADNRAGCAGGHSRRSHNPNDGLPLRFAPRRPLATVTRRLGGTVGLKASSVALGSP